VDQVLLERESMIQWAQCVLKESKLTESLMDSLRLMFWHHPRLRVLTSNSDLSRVS